MEGLGAAEGEPGAELREGGDAGGEDGFVVFDAVDFFVVGGVVLEGEDRFLYFGGEPGDNTVSHFFKVTVVLRALFDVDNVDLPDLVITCLVFDVPSEAVFIGVETVDTFYFDHVGIFCHLRGDGKAALLGDSGGIYVKVDIAMLGDQSHAQRAY